MARLLRRARPPPRRACPRRSHRRPRTATPGRDPTGGRRRSGFLCARSSRRARPLRDIASAAWPTAPSLTLRPAVHKIGRRQRRLARRRWRIGRARPWARGEPIAFPIARGGTPHVAEIRHERVALHVADPAIGLQRLAPQVGSCPKILRKGSPGTRAPGGRRARAPASRREGPGSHRETRTGTRWRACGTWLKPLRLARASAARAWRASRSVAQTPAAMAAKTSDRASTPTRGGGGRTPRPVAGWRARRASTGRPSRKRPRSSDATQPLRVAALGLLPHGLQDDRVEIARQAGRARAGAFRIAPLDQPYELGGFGVLDPIWLLVGDKLVEDHAERVDVGRGRHRLPADLLRARVFRREMHAARRWRVGSEGRHLGSRALRCRSRGARRSSW